MLNLFKRKHPKPVAPKPASTPEESINRIVNGVMKLNGSCRSLLLAANSITDLPVTTPLRLAVELSKKDKCLLVDLDYKRNAIAQVFEIDTPKLNPDLKVSAVQTPLENVDLWPADYFSLLKQMNLRSLLESARKKYAYIVLYAPYLVTLVDRKQIASCARHAVIVEPTLDKQSPLENLFQCCKCSVLLKMDPLS